MLQLLLDAHISPKVGSSLTAINSTITVHDLIHWQEGRFRESSDEELLEAAFRQGFTLVTFDLTTIPQLLKDWTEQGIKHGGVILVDTRTISPEDIGGLTRALDRQYKDQPTLTWTNRVLFLRRAPKGI